MLGFPVPHSSAHSARPSIIMGRIAAVILKLFLVMLDLLLNPIGCQAKSVLNIGVGIGCNKFVFVLSMGEDFHRNLVFPIAVKIYCHHDGSESVEVVKQLFSLLLELLLSFFVEVPVAGGDCHLHR